MTAPRPRIAFYAPLKGPEHPVASGDRTIARLLMRALDVAGYEVELASGMRSYDRGDAGRQQRLASAGRQEAGRLVEHWRSGAPAPAAWFCYHLYAKAPDYIGPAVCDSLGIPYIVAEATTARRHATGPWACGHAATVRALQRADAVVALNRRDMPAVTALLGRAAQHVFLPPFLDAGAHDTLLPGQRTAARSPLREADPALPWVVVVAMMRGGDKLSSYELLARACERPGAPFELLVAGDGEAAPQVRAAFATRERPVRWLGALDASALRVLLPACDLFAWPGVNEAFGMAMLEAQASGLPVLSCAASADVLAPGGVAEVVAHGRTGWLCPAGDVIAFAAALQALLAEPERRARYAVAARTRVEAAHDLRAAARALRGIIDTAILHAPTHKSSA